MRPTELSHIEWLTRQLAALTDDEVRELDDIVSAWAFAVNYPFDATDPKSAHPGSLAVWIALEARDPDMPRPGRAHPDDGEDVSDG